MDKNELRLHAFGRACHLAIDDSDGRGNELLSLCQIELARLEHKFSSYHPESITSQINQMAGTGTFVPLDAEARSLFVFINALWEESKHLFTPPHVCCKTFIIATQYQRSLRIKSCRFSDWSAGRTWRSVLKAHTWRKRVC